MTAGAAPEKQSIRLIATLKFRVVVIALVMTTALTALTTLFAMQAASRGMEPALLNAQAEVAERVAAHVGMHLQMRQRALADFAATLDAAHLRNPAHMREHMQSMPGLTLGFDLIGVSDVRGEVLATLPPQVTSADVPRPATHSYFRRVVEEGTAQTSEAIGLHINDDPAVAIAAPIRDGAGQIIGVAWGGVRVWSDELLGGLSGTGHHELIAIDQNGAIFMHPDRVRIDDNVAADPELGDIYRRWIRDGAIAAGAGASRFDQRDVIAYAGVPEANWLVVVRTPTGLAFAALDAARKAAWEIGIIAAVGSALIAGLVMYWLTRPVELLRKRAHRLLTDHDDIESDWPTPSGEVGDLARVFQHILRERSAVEASTVQLLARLQAVLDNASVGIAFTRGDRFELTSRTFCSILGYEQYEMIGGPTRMLHRTDQEYSEFDERAGRGLAETGAFSSEVLLLRKNREPFWAQLLGRQLEPGNSSAGVIWILEDVTEAHAMREQLTWTATHDALTGLVNRREFDRRLKALFAQVEDQRFSALFLDLDRFKAVNDTAGHAAGDRLLIDLSHIIDQAVRNADTAARLGGDEFAVLLPGCAEREAQRIAEEIRRLVEEYRLTWDGSDYCVGASVGVVEVAGGFANVEEVLHAADAACYEAKRGGRNQVCVYRATSRDAGAVRQA